MENSYHYRIQINISLIFYILFIAQILISVKYLYNVYRWWLIKYLLCVENFENDIFEFVEFLCSRQIQ